MTEQKAGRLAGKRVLITGTAGGQGEVAQRLFAAEGATVIGCDVKEGAAESTAEALRAQGYEVRGYTVDLTDPEQAGAWVRDGAASMGGLDVLYNNAAGIALAPFDRMDFALWQHAMKVEVDLVFHTTSAAWPLLQDGGGSLINIGSYSALIGIQPFGQVAHATAKGAVIAMTRALSAEGAPYGIRANSISPGFISTPATAKAIDPQGKAFQLSHALLQRAGTGEDVANMALYLASDESAWVTGQNFCIDGGATAGWRDDAETARLLAKVATA